MMHKISLFIISSTDEFYIQKNILMHTCKHILILHDNLYFTVQSKTLSLDDSVTVNFPLEKKLRVKKTTAS